MFGICICPEENGKTEGLHCVQEGSFAKPYSFGKRFLGNGDSTLVTSPPHLASSVPHDTTLLHCTESAPLCDLLLAMQGLFRNPIHCQHKQGCNISLQSVFLRSTLNVNQPHCTAHLLNSAKYLLWVPCALTASRRKFLGN
ncbi:hypothetical protein HGM15179_009051, partial [Zosterops borbonicus]